MARSTLLLAAAIGLTVSQAVAQTACPHDGVSVAADAGFERELCELTSQAIAELAACSVPLERTVLVEIVETLPDGCLGQYDCGEDRIELLSRHALRRTLESDETFSQIDWDVLFYSLLVHELVHAALESMPCPFSDCVASQEYVAYAMQMRSLTPDARVTLLTRPDFNRQIAADEINPFILLMAPEIFMQKAWRHFSQQDDPCGFVGDVVSGDYLFDYQAP